MQSKIQHVEIPFGGACVYAMSPEKISVTFSIILAIMYHWIKHKSVVANEFIGLAIVNNATVRPNSKV